MHKIKITAIHSSRNKMPIEVCKLSTCCAKKRPTFLLSPKTLQLKISCTLVSTAINSPSKNSGQSNKRAGNITDGIMEISAIGCSGELMPCTLIKEFHGPPAFYWELNSYFPVKIFLPSLRDLITDNCGRVLFSCDLQH